MVLSIFYDIAIKVIFSINNTWYYVELIFSENITLENFIMCIRYNNIHKIFKFQVAWIIFLNNNKITKIVVLDLNIYSFYKFRLKYSLEKLYILSIISVEWNLKINFNV